MSRDDGKKIPQELLLCFECGETCPCLIYGVPLAHVHFAGGDDRYPLCAECQERWLQRHRPLVPGSTITYRWLDTCEEGCPWDDIKKTVPRGEGIGREAR